MKIVKRLVLSVVLIFSAYPVYAAVDCLGTVTLLSLSLNGSGTVTLSLSGGPSATYLCDIDGAGRNGVSPKVCQAMYGTLMAAKTTSKKVSIRFYNYDSCAAIPGWANSGELGWTVLLTD